MTATPPPPLTATDRRTAALADALRAATDPGFR